MHWLTKMDKLPPNVCRLLAREPKMSKRPLTTEQIAKRSGLSKQTVLKISKLRSWATLSLAQMEAFKFGCGVIPGREAIHRAYLKRTFTFATPLFHIQKLRKQTHDPRLDKFMVKLMMEAAETLKMQK